MALVSESICFEILKQVQNDRRGWYNRGVRKNEVDFLNMFQTGIQDLLSPWAQREDTHLVFPGQINLLFQATGCSLVGKAHGWGS